MDELIQKLREFFSELESDPSAEQVADALQEANQPAYQAVYDRGHGGATSKHKEEKRELEAERDELKEELSEARDRIEALEEENPDAAKIREEYEAEIEELKKEHAEEMETVRGELEDTRVGNARSRLVNRMVALGLDPDYADVMADKHMDRIQFEDGEVQVLQEGKSIPIQATGEHGPLGQLAEEVHEGADPKWKVSTADGGSGTESGGGSGSEGSKYDQIRENAKEERERKKMDGPPVEERMGINTGS